MTNDTHMADWRTCGCPECWDEAARTIARLTADRDDWKTRCEIERSLKAGLVEECDEACAGESERAQERDRALALLRRVRHTIATWKVQTWPQASVRLLNEIDALLSEKQP